MKAEITKFERRGDLAAAEGPGFSYSKMGELEIFEFTGKTGSRRVIRELVKRLSHGNRKG